MTTELAASLRTLVLALGLAAVGASVVHALPLDPASALSQSLLQRARLALRGHPAESKIELLAEQTTASPSVVRVLPLRTQVEVSLTVMSAPRCDGLAERIAAVNDAIVGVTDVADEVLVELDQLQVLKAAQAEFVAQYAAQLALARQVEADLFALTLYRDALASELAYEEDAALRTIYEDELRRVDDEALRLRSAPQNVAALAQAEQAAQLLDRIDLVRREWEVRTTQRLASQETALAQAQDRYETLAATEVASTVAELPVWDADVLTLFRQSPATDVRFEPAALANLTFRLEDGLLPREVPVTLHVESETIALPGLSPLPLRPGLAIVAPQATPLAPARVRVALSLAAYCASLQAVEIVEIEESGSQGPLAAHRVRYQLQPRTHSAVELYTVRASYQVAVQAPPQRILCTFGGGAITASKSSPIAAVMSAAGRLVPGRIVVPEGPGTDVFTPLAGLGLRCSLPDPTISTDSPILRSAMQQALQQAASEPRAVSLTRQRLCLAESCSPISKPILYVPPLETFFLQRTATLGLALQVITR